MMGYCRKCREKWTGLARVHCISCHRTFNSVSGFDEHRRGFKCTDPLEIGMKMSDLGIWARPMPENAILSYAVKRRTRL